MPMYDWAVVRPATDVFWDAIRAVLAARGIEAPPALDRDGDYIAQWTDPRLILSQTCGLPFRSFLAGRVTYVGTLDYGVEGAPPGYYRSLMVARANDRRPLAELAGRFLCNGFDSQSGWGGPAEWLRGEGMTLEAATVTGAHRRSAEMIAAGEGDLAGIDAITWRFLVRELPELAARLRILATTPPTPGQPMITALGRDPVPIREAVAEALAALAPEHRAALGLRGMVLIPLTAYQGVPTPHAPEATSRSV